MQPHGLCCELTRWMPVVISVFFRVFMETAPSKKVVQPHINQKKVRCSRGFRRELSASETPTPTHSPTLKNFVALGRK